MAFPELAEFFNSDPSLFQERTYDSSRLFLQRLLQLGMNLPTRTLAPLPERPQKSLPLLIIKENSLLPVPSAHHMINPTSVFASQLSCNQPNFSDF